MVSYDNLVSRLKQFKGGQLVTKISEWRKLTRDKTVPDIIKGDIIEFTQVPPNQHITSNPNFANQEEIFTDMEIEKLIYKNIIVETEHETTEFVSPISIIHKLSFSVHYITGIVGYP